MFWGIKAAFLACLVRRKLLKILKVESKLCLANTFTKVLGRLDFERGAAMLNVVRTYSPVFGEKNDNGFDKGIPDQSCTGASEATGKNSGGSRPQTPSDPGAKSRVSLVVPLVMI